MVANAIDHGILKLNSAIKESPDGFNAYIKERDKRLSELDDSDFVEVHLVWAESKERSGLEIGVRDSGSGYDVCAEKNTCDLAFSGRGLRLIRNLAQSVEIYPPGNFIKVVLGPS
jgi:hypothetical protein